MTGLIDIDKAVFKWINTDLSNGVFDVIIPWLREPLLWVPVYIFIVTFLLLNFRKKGYYIFAFLVITAGSADFISSSVIKKSVQRVRPCRALTAEDVIQRVHCGGGYSFTSNHAANHFAVSFFLIFLLPFGRKKLKYLLAIWAGIIAFAQVYVGVHYPLDVISGALLGISIACLMSITFTKFWKIYSSSRFPAT